MNYKIHDEFEQGSQEWLDMKIKFPLTGTAAYNLLTRGKAYAIDSSIKSQERSKNHPFYSKYTEWGIKMEPVARKLMNSRLEMSEEYSNVKFEEHGFIESLDYEMCGYSPDGVHLENGKIKYMCEIKNYQMKHAWEIWESGGPDAAVMSQIQWGLFLTGAEFTMFCLYCPMMSDEWETPDNKVHNERRLMLKRIYPDKKFFDKFKERLNERV